MNVNLFANTPVSGQMFFTQKKKSDEAQDVTPQAGKITSHGTLGFGGFGQTYKCDLSIPNQELSQRKVVAAKCINEYENSEYLNVEKEKTANEDVSKPLTTAYVYDKQSSQYVAQYFGHFMPENESNSEKSDSQILIFELVDGTTLKKIFRKNYVTSEDRDILRKIANKSCLNPEDISALNDAACRQKISNQKARDLERIANNSACVNLEEKSALENIIKKNNLSSNDIFRLVAQLAAGLSWIHKHEYTHRDVKSDNVMCDAQNNIKIIDLGCAVTPRHPEFMNRHIRQVLSRAYSPGSFIPVEFFKLMQEITDYAEENQSGKAHDVLNEQIKKNFTNKVEALFQPRIDIPNIAIIFIQFLFGSTRTESTLVEDLASIASDPDNSSDDSENYTSENEEKSEHSEFSSGRYSQTELIANINNRRILCNLIKNFDTDNSNLINECNKNLEDGRELLEVLKEIQNGKTSENKDGTENKGNLIAYLNAEMIDELSKNSSKERSQITWLSKGQEDLVQLICLLCLNEDPEARPLAGSIGYLAELGYAGMADIKAIINCAKQDLSEKEFAKIFKIAKECHPNAFPQDVPVNNDEQESFLETNAAEEIVLNNDSFNQNLISNLLSGNAA